MGDDQSMEDKILDIKKICQMLPHRYPFLLVDKVVQIDLEADHIVCQKNVTMNEEFFQGHFPEQPLMPGVLILEALAQAAGILMYLKGFQKIKVLTGMQDVKFRRAVFPGDVLKLDIQALFMSHRGGRVKAEAYVDGQKVAEAEISFSSLNM